MTSPARALDAAFVPDANRDKLCVYTVRITENISQPQLATAGRVELLSDAANPPTTLRCQARQSTDLQSQVVSNDFVLTYWVPAGHRVLLKTVTETGNVTFALIVATEIVFTAGTIDIVDGAVTLVKQSKNARHVAAVVIATMVTPSQAVAFSIHTYKETATDGTFVEADADSPPTVAVLIRTGTGDFTVHVATAATTKRTATTGIYDFSFTAPSSAGSRLEIVAETVFGGEKKRWTAHVSVDAVDSISTFESSDAKNSARVATTASISLQGLQVLDGVQLALDDRVLIKDQTLDPQQNGPYLAKPGIWVRSPDADSSDKLSTGAHLFVEEGTVNRGLGFYLYTQEPITLGVTPLEWKVFTAKGPVVAGQGISVTDAQTGQVVAARPDGASIEFDASDRLRVKPGSIGSTQLSFDPATQAELDAHAAADKSTAHPGTIENPDIAPATITQDRLAFTVISQAQHDAHLATDKSTAHPGTIEGADIANDTIPPGKLTVAGRQAVTVKGTIVLTSVPTPSAAVPTVLRTYGSGVLADAAALPVVTVYKKTGAGAFTTHASPAVTKRAGTTGIYDFSWTTSGTIGDLFEVVAVFAIGDSALSHAISEPVVVINASTQLSPHVHNGADQPRVNYNDLAETPTPTATIAPTVIVLDDAASQGLVGVRELPVVETGFGDATLLQTRAGAILAAKKPVEEVLQFDAELKTEPRIGDNLELEDIGKTLVITKAEPIDQTHYRLTCGTTDGRTLEAERRTRRRVELLERYT